MPLAELLVLSLYESEILHCFETTFHGFSSNLGLLLRMKRDRQIQYEKLYSDRILSFSFKSILSIK